jgi:hypothetical protein
MPQPNPNQAPAPASPAENPGGMPQFKLTHYLPLTLEHNMNYVRPSFREDTMFRAVVEEAAALTSIALFLGMIAVWAEVLGTL